MLFGVALWLAALWGLVVHGKRKAQSQPPAGAVTSAEVSSLAELDKPPPAGAQKVGA